MVPTLAAYSARRWDGPTEAAVLVTLTLLPVLAALPRLGLYSDDYGMFLGFEQLRGQPLPQLLASVIEKYSARPGQGLASAFLYFAFGLDPLPYLLVETALVAASAVLLWSLLRRLGIQPTIAFGAAAIFCLLPQLSTVRLWFAALCVAAAMLFFLIGALSLLRWLDDRRAAWSLAAFVSWGLSLSFYELFVPFMLLMLAYAGWARASGWRPASLLSAARPLLPHALLIVAVLGVKALVSDRVDGWHVKYVALQALKLDYDRETEFGFNPGAFLFTNYVETFAFPLRSLPFFESGHTTQLACALIAAALVAAAMSRCDWHVKSGTAWRALGIGLGASLAGYGIFVLTGATSFTTSGIGNRTAVASAMGVALAASAGLVLATRLAPSWARRGLGSGLFALVAFVMTLATARIAEHWAGAYAKQQAILASARQDLDWLPAGSTILLDGVCPYDGPAIVFETDWDVSGALSLALGRPLAGTIITGTTRFGRKGVLAPIYAIPNLYRYGPTTYAYNPYTRSIVGLAEWRQAQAFLARRRPPRCPVGYEGHGVPI